MDKKHTRFLITKALCVNCRKGANDFMNLDVIIWDFLSGSDGKESRCNTGDLDSIPGSGRPPGEGSGNPLQYSCLENPMDRGAWWTTVHEVTKDLTRLSN